KLFFCLYNLHVWNTFSSTTITTTTKHHNITPLDPLNFQLHYYYSHDTQSMHNMISNHRQSLRHRSSSLMIRLSVDKQQPEQFEETNQFLTGWSFYSTPNIIPSSMDLQKLTEFAGGYWMSDEDLINTVNNYDALPIKSVIITTKDEYDNMLLLNSKSSRRTSRLSRNFKQSNEKITPILRAFSSFVIVSIDWFLQTIMNRKPPIWPIDSQYKLQ
ncbi:unnamed protein product, partial [Schistosoma turkestanicum]